MLRMSQSSMFIAQSGPISNSFVALSAQATPLAIIYENFTCPYSISRGLIHTWKTNDLQLQKRTRARSGPTAPFTFQAPAPSLSNGEENRSTSEDQWSTAHECSISLTISIHPLKVHHLQRISRCYLVPRQKTTCSGRNAEAGGIGSGRSFFSWLQIDDAFLDRRASNRKSSPLDVPSPSFLAPRTRAWKKGANHPRRSSVGNAWPADMNIILREEEFQSSAVTRKPVPYRPSGKRQAWGILFGKHTPPFLHSSSSRRVLSVNYRPISSCSRRSPKQWRPEVFL